MESADEITSILRERSRTGCGRVPISPRWHVLSVGDGIARV